MPHPDELLAAYVDGSASPDEARSVESHLATCKECREDVGFAMVGRAALGGLPELEEPGIARADLPGMLREDDKRIQRPTMLEERRGRGRVWQQVAWAAAVAAVAAGIIGAVVLISNGNTTKSATALLTFFIARLWNLPRQVLLVADAFALACRAVGVFCD